MFKLYGCGSRIDGIVGNVLVPKKAVPYVLVPVLVHTSTSTSTNKKPYQNQ